MAELLVPGPDIDNIIDHVRGCTEFFKPDPDGVHGGGGVGGAAEFSAANRETLRVPALFIFPGADSVAPNDQDGGLNQKNKTTVVFSVALDNTPDFRGQAGARNALVVRNLLFGCVLNWYPQWCCKQTEYNGGALQEINRGRIWWNFEFNFWCQLDERHGYQPEIPDWFLRFTDKHFKPGVEHVEGTELAETRVTFPEPEDE